MKKALLLISALALSGAMHAQSNNRDAVVNVENDYTPVVIEVGKKDFTPSTDRNVETQPSKAKFSKEGIAYTGFTSERDVDDILPKREELFPGYARLGYGITNDIDAKVAYRLGIGNNGTLDAFATFDGFKCNVGGLFDKWNSRFFNNALGVGYTHNFSALTLNVDGNFSNNVFNYQSTYAVTPLTNKQNSRNYMLAISGTSNHSGALSYKFNGDYEYTTRSYAAGVHNNIGESRFGVGGSMRFDIYSKWVSAANLDLRLDAFNYDRTLKTEYKGYDNHVSIDVNPSIALSLDNWAINAGVNMNFVTKGAMVFAIAPNISAEKNFMEHITVYGSITGGRENNSLAKLEKLAPYWGIADDNASRLKPTYRIVDINLGSRMSFKGISADVHAGYAYTKDDLLQVCAPQTVNDFSLIYSNFEQENTHNIHVAARVGYNFRSWVKMSADARYDFWSCKNKELLIMKPQVTANINAEARIIEHLTVQLGYNYTHYTKGETRGRITDKHDLYARVNYQINKRVGAYIQGNNLLNDKYYEYAGYQTRGIRGSFGATVNF